MKKLIIIGNKEFAEIADEYFSYDSDYEVIAFSVEKPYIQSAYLKGKPVVDFAKLPEYYPPKEYYVFTAITYRFATYVSSAAFVWKNNVEIGENSFIFEDNTLQYNVKIGHSVILWSGNHIGHSAHIGDNSFVSSHVGVSSYCTSKRLSFSGRGGYDPLI